MRHRGNCYVTCEALYHLFAKEQGYKPQVMRHEGGTHWFLKKIETIRTSYTGAFRCYIQEVIIDPTVSQFEAKPDYSKARGCGFLTKGPSKRAKVLMQVLVWQ